MGGTVSAPSVRRVILAWVLALGCVAVIATSDEDPEGLGVGPSHLEQIMREECANGTQSACEQVKGAK